eukprot:4066570-Alexandrium_andersonii.AAC.1
MARHPTVQPAVRSRPVSAAIRLVLGRPTPIRKDCAACGLEDCTFRARDLALPRLQTASILTSVGRLGTCASHGR